MFRKILLLALCLIGVTSVYAQRWYPCEEQNINTIIINNITNLPPGSRIVIGLESPGGIHVSAGDYHWNNTSLLPGQSLSVTAQTPDCENVHMPAALAWSYGIYYYPKKATNSYLIGRVEASLQLAANNISYTINQNAVSYDSWFVMQLDKTKMDDDGKNKNVTVTLSASDFFPN